jgi:hypothetical protein
MVVVCAFNTTAIAIAEKRVKSFFILNVSGFKIKTSISNTIAPMHRNSVFFNMPKTG